MGREVGAKRPFVVAQFVLSMGYHGRYWTVGCMTEESARRSFEKRTAANRKHTGSSGAVIAFERATLRPLCWTDEVTDPANALNYWIGG